MHAAIDLPDDPQPALDIVKRQQIHEPSITDLATTLFE
jgi:hypothetical protein